MSTFAFNPALFRRAIRILAALASDPKGQAAGYVDEAIHVHTAPLTPSKLGLRLVAADGHRACAITLAPVGDARPGAIPPRTIVIPADPAADLLRASFQSVELLETPGGFSGLTFHGAPGETPLRYGPHHKESYPIDVVNEHLRGLDVQERPNKRVLTFNADYLKDGLTIVSSLFATVNAVPKMDFVWPLDAERAFGLTAEHPEFNVKYVVMPYHHI